MTYLTKISKLRRFLHFKKFEQVSRINMHKYGTFFEKCWNWKDNNIHLPPRKTRGTWQIGRLQEIVAPNRQRTIAGYVAIQAGRRLGTLVTRRPPTLVTCQLHLDVRRKLPLGWKKIPENVSQKHFPIYNWICYLTRQ